MDDRQCRVIFRHWRQLRRYVAHSEVADCSLVKRQRMIEVIRTSWHVTSNRVWGSPSAPLYRQLFPSREGMNPDGQATRADGTL